MKNLNSEERKLCIEKFATSDVRSRLPLAYILARMIIPRVELIGEDLKDSESC
jgi:hypothetical protein